MAIAGLIIGILSICFLKYTIYGLPILGLIFSVISKIKEKKQNTKSQASTIGIVINIIGIVIGIVLLAFLFSNTSTKFGMAPVDTTYNTDNIREPVNQVKQVTINPRTDISSEIKPAAAPTFGWIQFTVIVLAIWIFLMIIALTIIYIIKTKKDTMK